MTTSGGLPIDPRGALLITTDPTDVTGQTLTFEQIRVLSADEYARYKQAHRAIFELLFGSIYTYFTSCRSLLRSTALAANQAFDVGMIQPNSAPDTLTTWVTSLRAAALSLCSSVAYHQEQLLQRTSAAHGKSGAAYGQVKKIFNDLYDQHASYRFLCRLRNVMVHGSMEAVAVSARRTLVGGQIATAFDVTIDRAFIAQSEMTEQVKNEIVGLNENPNVLTLAEDVAGPLAIANNQIEAVLYADTSSAYQAVVDFDDLFSGKPGLRAIANDLNDGPGRHIPRYTPWSQQVIDFARQQFEASRPSPHVPNHAPGDSSTESQN